MIDKVKDPVETMRKLYEVLGREFPNENLLVNAVSLEVSFTFGERLEVRIVEDMTPVDIGRIEE